MKNKLDKLVGQEASSMKSQPNLTAQKNGIYQFRFIIPNDVQGLLKRKVVKVSLKTSNKNEATIKASALRTQWLKEVEKARKLLERHPSKSETDSEVHEVYITESGRLIDFRRQKFKTLSDETIQKIAKTYLRTLLGYEEEYRFSEALELQDRIDITDKFIQSSKEEHKKNAIAYGVDVEMYYPGVEPFIDTVCKIDFNYLDETTKRKLTRECLKAHQKAGTISTHRQESWIDIDEAVPESSTFKASISWNEIFEGWLSSKIDRPSKTIVSFKRSFTEFQDFCKSRPVEELRARDAIEYRKYLISKIDDKSLERITANNKLAHLGAIFNQAKQDDRLTQNIFEGRTNISPSSNEGEGIKHPFTHDDMQLIFNSEIFTKSEPINSWSNLTNRWMIAITYATGARPEEIAQLRTEDLIFEYNCYFIRISATDSTGRKVGTLKNTNSIRKIPVHPDLIHAGIIEFFNTQKSNGHFFVFNDLNGNKHSRRYASWGNWFNREIKKTIPNTKSTFYSFRDAFCDACRNADIDLPTMNKFMGHSNNNISDAYGIGKALMELSEKMKTVKFVCEIPKIST